MEIHETVRPASVNGVAIDAESIEAERPHHAHEADPVAAACRALVIRELLRQRAVSLDLSGVEAPLDDAVLDVLLERELNVPQPTRADCERYYAQHPARFRRNDIIHASHILFAVTGRVPLALLRSRAEQTLQQVVAAPDTFEALARELSNCPSAAVGGNLGQLLRGDSVPEFERELFEGVGIGIVPKLVNTRFGFHIVRIERRIDGEALPFDAVETDIAAFLDARVRHKAMQQYVQVLAAAARIEGDGLDDLASTSGPLVQ